MDQQKYEQATAIATCLLSRLLLIHLDEAEISKLMYMLCTGFEAFDRNGINLQLYPIGPDLSWILEFLTGSADRQKQFRGDINPIAKVNFTGERIHTVLNRAAQDPVACDAMKELGVIYSKQKVPVPPPLMNFIIDDSRGGKKPKRRGTSGMQKYHRDVAIMLCISVLDKNDFSPISKSSSLSKTLSLFDAVQKALKALGITVSYEAIKSIWGKRKSLQKFIDPFQMELEKDGEIQLEYGKIPPNFPTH